MPAGESEARAKTRDTFNEVLKKYTDPPPGKKKAKKKAPEPQSESIVLQTLKKSLDLEKDSEDAETVLQNTYRPEQGSPRFTKNRRREREAVEKVINVSHGADEVEAPQPAKGKRKSRRELPLPPDDPLTSDPQRDSSIGAEERPAPGPPGGKEGRQPGGKGRRGAGGFGEEAAARPAEPEDELLQRYQQRITREAEEAERTRPPGAAALNNDVGKKKKKKLRSAATESDLRDPDGDAEQGVADTQNTTEAKGKRKNRKKKVVVEEAELPQRPALDDSLVLGVYVHRTDRLKTDLRLSHPMVKVHVVDELTGQYMRKEDSHRPVSSFYEQESVDYVLPIMTQPFHFKKNKSTVPEWEEQIIFNERFGHFLQDRTDEPKVILFFEVLDFMTMEEARAHAHADVGKQERGFRKVAWAFLKLVGTNGVLNVDSKLRLQLFCPPARAKPRPKTIEVVEWWKRYPRDKYSSTLYVTVKGLKPPEHVDPSIRSMMALQEERGSTSYSELQSEVTRRSLPQPAEPSQASVFRWSRMPGQVCRIPNKPVLSFRGGHVGCFTVRFSHSGTALAAACSDRDAFPVIVYEIPSGTVLAVFSGHLSVVYDLCWSRDDRSLLSASSDGTVREWNVERLLGVAQKVLPHPSFVYSGRYHPAAAHLVVTGGYDGLLRAWRLDVRDVNGQLLRELEGHGGFVNAACFDCEGTRMFSADNGGVIIVWRTPVGDGPQPCEDWCIERRIEEKDLSGTPINLLEVHPNGRRLLIHAKDSVLRVMDLRILAVRKYTGATNYRERIYSTFSPCGNFLFSGSEDGLAYVWNAETGDQVAVYSELCYPTALRGVAFHPHENMVAFCAFGQGQPVLVYQYDRKVAQLEAQTIRGGGRTASMDTRTPEPMAILLDRTASVPTDRFAQAARLSLKMQRVKDKLDSVLDPHRSLSTPGYPYDQGASGVSLDQAGWSRTLDPPTAATGLGASLPPPSLLSPHSKLHLSGALAEQLIPQAALSCQHRGFSPVGQRVKGALSLQTSLPAPAGQLEADPATAALHPTVVLLYDYSADRSDELTVRRGDVIQVLYKDNDNWWFGRLADGRQGYFPAAYAVDQTEYNEDLEAAGSEGPGGERSTPTKVSAAVSSSGELRFLSEQDTEPELTSTKRTARKKRVKRHAAPEPSARSAATSDPDASGSSGRRARSAGRPLPERPAGRANGAFESDT